MIPPPRRLSPLLFICLLPALGACAALFSYTQSEDHLKFPHAPHARAKVGCLTCHEEIYDAKTLAASYLPPEAKCLECHREKKEKGECGFCHTDAQRARPYPKRERAVTLSHELHIEKVKEDCARCHVSLPEPGQPSTPPTMAACLGCHEHQTEYDQGSCERCHRDLSRYALKPVSDFSHEGNYVRTHARTARASAAACAKCHEQTFCADCHASTVSTRIEIKYPENQSSYFIHRDDFLSVHTIEAKASPASCSRCHGTSFCQNCHARQSLTSTSSDPRNPHPPGWEIPGSAQFHGVAARRDIVSCASCHDQGPSTNCIRCHRVGGVGGNPHPINWLSHHDMHEMRSNPMCLYCHL